jgi:hypothetical protein
MRGFFGVLFFGLVAIVAGLIGYQVGLGSTAGVAERVVYVGGGWFGGFGFLFFLFFLFLIFSFAGRRRWGGGHWGSGYGRGPWGGPMGPGSQGGPGSTDASSDPRRQWIADMHRSLHEAESKTGEPTSPPSPTKV